MKRIVFFLLILVCSYQAHAQVLIALIFGDKLNSERVEFGLEGGCNFSRISSFESNNVLPKFNVGLYFNYQVKKSWYLYTGVLVKASLGSDKLTTADLARINATTYTQEGTYSQQIKYFVVPLLAKYQFKNRIYLEAGPQASLMYKAWVQYDVSEKDSTAKVKNFNTDKIHRVYFGLVAGFGYKLQSKLGMSIGVKYYYGLVDVYKDIDGSRNNDAGANRASGAGDNRATTGAGSNRDGAATNRDAGAANRDAGAANRDAGAANRSNETTNRNNGGGATTNQGTGANRGGDGGFGGRESGSFGGSGGSMGGGNYRGGGGSMGGGSRGGGGRR